MTSGKKETDKPSVYDRLKAQLEAALWEVEADKLPGWDAVVADNEKARSTLRERYHRIRIAMEDEDTVVFSWSLASWRSACERVNQIVAEGYRERNRDPAKWELRYVKWMRIKYMRFDSPLGEFFVVPRMPKRPPKVDHWYTVDEMIGFLEPGAAALINTFKKLPQRPESLEEKEGMHTHVYIEGGQMTVKGVLHKEKKRRVRKAVR